MRGIHRVSWDLRQPAPVLPPPRPAEAGDDVFTEPRGGPLVMPGTYKVTLAKRVGGVVTPLPGSQEFAVVVEGAAGMKPADHKVLFDFQQKVVRLDRAVSGALNTANDLTSRLEQIRRALDRTPGIASKWKDLARTLTRRNRDILRALRGDVVLRGRNMNTPVSIAERVRYIVSSQRFSLARPTLTQKEAYTIAGKEFAEELSRLRRLMEVDLKNLEKAMDDAGAPYTPGRLPEWKEK
jgi:hypothetical protein